jgi:hypothetical protein
MLRAAQQNPVDGRPPKVVFDFPTAVSSEVRAALEAMGAEVRGPVREPSPSRYRCRPVGVTGTGTVAHERA